MGMHESLSRNFSEAIREFSWSPAPSDERHAMMTTTTTWSNRTYDELLGDYAPTWNSTSGGEPETEFTGVGRHPIDDIFDIYRPGITMFNKVATPVLYAIGFPGNLFSFLVWIRPRMRPSSGCYLAALAMTDLVFLVLHVFFELQFTWHAISWLELPLLCELFPVIFLASQYLSPLLVLGFSVERYISVCHPFKRDAFCSTSRAIRVIIALLVSSILLNAVQAYFWTHSQEPERTCNIRAEVTDTTGSAMSVWAIWSWITEMLIFGLVPLMIFILNVMVIAEYRKVSAKELELTGSMMRTGNGRPKRHFAASSATTVMLLAVSFYLIASTLPVTICYVLYPSYHPGDMNLTDDEVWTDRTWQRYFDYWSAKVVVQELGMSHFAFNIIIYLATGRIFRRELRMLVFADGRGPCARVRHARRKRNISQISRDATNGASEFEVRHHTAPKDETLLTDELSPTVAPFSKTFV